MARIDYSRDIDRLKDEVDALRRDVVSHSRSAREAGLARGHEALERAEMFGRNARKRVARADEKLGHTLEERPVTSLLAALGVGFLIATLLGVGRHDSR